MATQDTFNQYASLGYHGQLNTAFPFEIISAKAEGSDIGFGLAVFDGTADDQAALPGASPTSPALSGLTIRTTYAVDNNASQVPLVKEFDTMSLLKKGRMFVTVSDGSAKKGQVYVVPLTGELVSTSTDNVALVGVTFVRTAAAGEVTEIEINR